MQAHKQFKPTLLPPSPSSSSPTPPPLFSRSVKIYSVGDTQWLGQIRGCGWLPLWLRWVSWRSCCNLVCSSVEALTSVSLPPLPSLPSLPSPTIIHTQIEYGDWNSLGGSEVEAKEALHRFCPRKFTHLALEHDQRYAADGACNYCTIGRIVLVTSLGPVCCSSSVDVLMNTRKQKNYC